MTIDLQTTQDRDTIIGWAERRSAHAARVAGMREDAPENAEVEVGALRIGFPGYAASVEKLEPMGWEEWFEVFEAEELTFGFRETTDDGHPSNEYDLLK